MLDTELINIRTTVVNVIKRWHGQLHRLIKKLYPLDQAMANNNEVDKVFDEQEIIFVDENTICKLWNQYTFPEIKIFL